jgi:nicotinamidase-related amidase
MQVALFAGPAKWDAAGLVGRINHLSERIRGSGGQVVFVRHTQDDGELKAGSPGWQILPDLILGEDDVTISKSTCDCFAGTQLPELIPPQATRRLIVTGFATEFCVDTTVRSAAVKGYDVWAPEDGHTTADRAHLSAELVMKHHVYVWGGFIGSGGPVKTTPMADL